MEGVWLYQSLKLLSSMYMAWIWPTDCSCGVWCRERTFFRIGVYSNAHTPKKIHSHLVCSSAFWKYSLKWQWICQFDIMEENVSLLLVMFYLYLVLHNLKIIYFHLPYYHSANFAVIQALLQLYQAVNDLVSNLVIPRVDATGSSWWVLVQVMALCRQDIAWPILTQICVIVWRHRDIVDTYIPFCNVGVNLKWHFLRWWQQGVSLKEQ